MSLCCTFSISHVKFCQIFSIMCYLAAGCYIFFWKNEMTMIKEYQGASNFLLFVHVRLSLGNQIIYYVEIKSPSPFVDVYLDELNLPL